MNENKFRWVRYIIIAICDIVCILSCLLGSIYISIWINSGVFSIISIIGIIYMILGFALYIAGLIYVSLWRY